MSDIVRRSSADKKWQETKNIVKKRDNNACRLVKVLSALEYMMLRKNAGFNLQRLDPAHIISVGEHPEYCYETWDICLLNHYSHSLLDSCKDPISAKPITKKEVEKWWIRILQGNKEQYKEFTDNIKYFGE